MRQLRQVHNMQSNQQHKATALKETVKLEDDTVA